MLFLLAVPESNCHLLAAAAVQVGGALCLAETPGLLLLTRPPRLAAPPSHCPDGAHPLVTTRERARNPATPPTAVKECSGNTDNFVKFGGFHVSIIVN